MTASQSSRQAALNERQVVAVSQRFIISAVAAAVSMAIGIAVLAMADSSQRGGASLPLILLGGSFLVVLASIAILSLSPRMHLSSQVMLLYFALYLLLPGYSHVASGVFPFYAMRYSQSVTLAGAVCNTLFLAGALLAIILSNLIAAHRGAPSARANKVIFIPSAKLAIGLIVASYASLALYIQSLGLEGAFTVRQASSVVDLDSTSAGMIIGIPRIISLLPLIFAILTYRFTAHRRFALWVGLFGVLPAVIVHWPPALPRSQLFGDILLFSVLLFDFSSTRSRAILSLLFLAGATVAMPLADHFTRKGGTLADLKLSETLSVYFASGDFDGLQSTNNAILFVDRHGPQMGDQLKSVALFFVPRSVWPDKAQPTGSLTAETAGYTFFNISQPLPSEFFVDFSWAGAILGGLLVGWILARIDRYIDRGWRMDLRTRVVAGIMVGFTLMIYRGTLLGVIGPFALLCACTALFFVVSFRKQRGQERVRARSPSASVLPA